MTASKKSRWRKRATGAARVTLFFIVLGVISGSWFVRRARAEAVHEGIKMGKELAPLADLLEGRYLLSLNGQKIFLANHVTEQPVGAVLDRFTEHCRAHSGAIGDLWSDVAREHKLPDAEARSLVSDLSIVRDEEDGEGIVLCLAKNGDLKPADALKAFADTGDLGALGKLRYAFAKPDGQGRTHVMTVWTEGRFRVDQVLSEAEGRIPEDTSIIPRPPESRFIFDARIQETAYAVRVYRSAKSVGEVVSFYDTAMKQKGWDVISPPVPGGETHAYLKEGVQFLVGATTDKETGATLVSIAEMGAAPPQVFPSGATP